MMSNVDESDNSIKREIFSKVAPMVKDAAPQLNLRIRSFELGSIPPTITGKDQAEFI